MGLRDGVPYLHSHMTGVHSDYRDRGVGRMLKLFQREEALSRDIRLICWTFDPLEFRNAYFNLNRLGAISRKYLPNFYGVTTSPLHRGIATDRLLAEWHLDSPRVVAAVAGARRPDARAIFRGDGNASRPQHVRSQDRSSTRQQTQLARSRLREEFTKYFNRGYAAVAVRKDPTAPAYLLCSLERFLRARQPGAVHSPP